MKIEQFCSSWYQLYLSSFYFTFGVAVEPIFSRGLYMHGLQILSLTIFFLSHLGNDLLLALDTISC